MKKYSNLNFCIALTIVLLSLITTSGIAQAPVPKGGTIIEYANGLDAVGEWKLANSTGERVKDLSISITHPDIAAEDLPKVEKLYYGDDSDFDDNDDGQLDINQEDDDTDDTPDTHARIIFDNHIGRNDEIDINYELDGPLPVGAKVIFRFSITGGSFADDDQHYDLLETYEIEEGGLELESEFENGGPRFGYWELKNITGQKANDLTIILEHESIDSVDWPRFNKLYIGRAGTDQVDDNDNKKIDAENENEGDPVDSTPEHKCRSIFKTVHKNRIIKVYFELDRYMPPGTKVTFKFSKEDEEGVHYDIMNPVFVSGPGQTAVTFVPQYTQNGSFQIINESGEYLSMAVLPPGPYPFADFKLEPPYDNSLLETSPSGGSTLYFDPPLNPYDYATVNFKLEEPVAEPQTNLSFLPLESYSYDCALELEELTVEECGPLNYYDIQIKARVNADYRECVEYTFVNNTGQAASDLHVTFTGTGGSLHTTIVKMPQGCAQPDIPSNGTITNQMDIIWEDACIEEGESVTVKVCTENGPLAVAGGEWTLDGEGIGQLEQKDYGEGPGGGKANKGAKIEINGSMLGVLPFVDGLASGNFTLPANGSVNDLQISLTSEELECALTVSEAFISPECNQEVAQIACDDFYLDPDEVPNNWYPWDHVLPGAPKRFGSPSNPVDDIRIVPPQMLDEDDAYSCGEDYLGQLTPYGYPATEALLQFFRPGAYFVRIVYADGTVEERICIVDERCVKGFGEGDSGTCYGGVSREIPCGVPDIAVVSSELGFAHPWGETGKIADGIDKAAELICEAYEANDEQPVEVAIDGHGASGYVLIGKERLDISNVKQFADKVKNKISKLTLFACSAAFGEKGKAFVCELQECLEVEVTAFEAIVSSTVGSDLPTRWFTPVAPFVKTEVSDIAVTPVAPWEVKLYPNPTKGLLQLDFGQTSTQDISWQLMDAQGRILAEQPSKKMADVEGTSLFLHHYPAGMYYLQIGTEKYRVVRKIVKVD